MKKPEGFDPIEDLIEDIRQGKMVLLVDDEDRENEGDLVLAADHVTPTLINFMALEARGLICLALSSQQIDRLQLPQMVRDDQNFSPNKTAFTVSIEASWGVSTGISAADRAHTIKVASNPEAKPSDVHMPGHIFPIRAQQGGVLKRAGHTEGSVDLAKLAGLQPAAVICEVMNSDGSMARVPDLKKFAQKHGIKIGTIVDLIEYRLSREVLVEELLHVELPAQFHGFKARVFKSKIDGAEHLVLQKGEVSKDRPTLVRVHVDGGSRDLFCQLQNGESSLQQALVQIQNEGEGLLVLLRGLNQPRGLVGEIKAICGEKHTPEMDSRDYGIGAQILRAVGAHQIRLLSNRVEKRVGLKAFDLEIVEWVSLKEDDHGKENSKEDTSKESQSTANRSGHLTLQ
ncbi:MAG: 3,4-dihydroxy-2-butanone-4-phosphate synthase [Pseudobdellovibrionaceae bacterium]